MKKRIIILLLLFLMIHLRSDIVTGKDVDVELCPQNAPVTVEWLIQNHCIEVIENKIRNNQFNDYELRVIIYEYGATYVVEEGGSASRVIELGDYIDELIDGIGVRGLLNRGVSLRKMIEKKADIKDLLDAGIGSVEIVGNGGNASEVIYKGGDVDELIDYFGVCGLKNLGVSLKDMINYGADIDTLLDEVTPGEIINSGGRVAIGDVVDKAVKKGMVGELLKAVEECQLYRNYRVELRKIVEGGGSIRKLVECADGCDLITAGADSFEVIKAKGFSKEAIGQMLVCIPAKNLKNAGASLTQLVEAGAKTSELLTFSTSCEIVAAGRDLKEVASVGNDIENLLTCKSAKELYEAGVSLNRLITAKASVIELLKFVTAMEIVKSGGSLTEVVTAGGDSAIDNLLRNNINVKSLYDAGVSLSRIISIGKNIEGKDIVKEIRANISSITVCDLLAAGVTVKELLSYADITAADILDCGIDTVCSLISAGVPLSELLDLKVPLEKLLSCGVSPQQLLDEGVSCSEIRSAGGDITCGNTTPDTEHGQSPDKENSVGEPVNIVTGNMYTTEEDLVIPSRGVLSFNFSRTYNSHKVYDGPIGYGWTHSYNIFLEEWQEEGKVKIMEADGRAIYFTREQDNTFTPPKGEYSTLSKDTSGYLWKLKNGIKYSFDLSGKLLTIEDRSSNRITLTYNEANLLSKVTDTVNREVSFSYNSDNRLTQLTDPQARTVKYEYDASGNLIKVTDLRGKNTVYQYNSTHNITKITNPVGGAIYFEYDRQDRCTANYSDNNVLRVDMSYDPDNERTTITDSRGNKTIKVYNDDGLVTEVIDPDGDTTYYIWDENYNRTQIKDKNGNVTNMAYDSQGNLISTTDAQGNITAFEYEPKYSFISKTTDSQGNVTQYNYDSKGNLISLENALGYKTTYSYDALGELTATEDARTNVTTYKYDYWGNLIETRDALGNITSFSYNPIGRLISTQNAKGSITNYEYDASSTLITKTTYPDGTYAQFTYDDASRRTSVTDPNGNTTTFEYTPNGKVSKTKDALGRTIIYTYDTEENLTSVPDAKGSITTYTYDVLNRLIEEKNPLGITAVYQYDKVGNKISVTDGNSQTTRYEYDSLNRFIKTIYPDQTTITYTYDKLGRQIMVEDSRGKIQYKYDKLGRLLEEDGPFEKDTISYEYDGLGNRVKMSDQGGGLTLYEYDELNRLIQTTDHRPKTEDQRPKTEDQGPKTTDYKYDEVGNITEMVYPNGMKAEYSFDETNHLTTLVNRTSANEIISNYSYEYDLAGRRTKVILPNGQISYTYDNANQLTGENRTSPEAFYAINYTYDPAGNRTEMVKDGVTYDYTYNEFNQLLTQTNSTYPGGNNVLIQSQASDENIDKVLVNDLPATIENGIFTAKVPLLPGTNTVTVQVFDKAKNVVTQTLPLNLNDTTDTTYTYDNNGNLIQKSHRGEQTLYSYDYDNMLTSVVYPDGSTTKYVYGAEGRRVKGEDRGEITNFYYDGNSVIIERDGEGNTTASYTRGLSLGGGIGSIISKHETEKDYYYIYDAQGNVTHLTDEAGKVIIHYEYDAFGNIVYQTGSLENDYLYQTKEYDSQSGLVYFGARYYDPGIGRFTTPDPLGMVDGPNRYVYCSNNPIGFLDPWGMCGGKIDLSGMASGFVAGGLLLSDDATVIGIANDVLIPFIIVAGVGYTIYQNREAIGELILTTSPVTTIVTVAILLRKKFAPGSYENPLPIPGAPGGKDWKPPEKPKPGKEKWFILWKILEVIAEHIQHFKG